MKIGDDFIVEDKKANVLIVHNYYQIPGGEDTVVANEMKLLADNGHQVSLYSRNNSELAKFTKLQKLLLPVMTVFNLKTYKEIRRIIREKKIDVVHVHNTLNLVSPSVYYAAKSCNVPVVQTIHNFRLLCPAATFYRDGHICEECLQKELLCAAKHNCYRDSKLQTLACVITTKIHRALGIYRQLNYICLTDFNKRKLLEINKGKKQELVLPDSVYVKPNFTFEGSGIPENEEGEYYLFSGRVEKIKGMDILLEAFSQLPEEKLMVAGKGTEMDKYQNVVSQKHLKNVIFLGFQEKAQLQELMKKAKAVIVPSQWYEGFPMTVVEAFSMGVPVIGSNLGNVGSVIKDGVNGWLFHYDSVEDLVEKVRFCSATPRKQLQVKFEENLMPEGNYQALVTIYNHVIRKK